MTGGWSVAGCGPLLRPRPHACIKNFVTEAAPTPVPAFASEYMAWAGHAVFGTLAHGSLECRSAANWLLSNNPYTI